jgi:lysophospholipase L1-like esterase
MMKIALYDDSLTEGRAGVSYIHYLQQLLPEYEILNYGYGGDTVISLYRHVVHQKLAHPVDVSFVFVGVNDVLVHVSWNFPLLKTLFRQPWAKDDAEFAGYYRQLLDLLSPRASQLFTVPSLFIGEDVSNRWNKQLARFSEIIRQISADYARVDYLDLRSDFIAALDPRMISSYVLKSATRVVLDTLFLNDVQIDRESAARGLQFTIDGVHLNSHGARWVAENFAVAIRNLNQREEWKEGVS